MPSFDPKRPPKPAQTPTQESRPAGKAKKLIPKIRLSTYSPSPEAIKSALEGEDS